ncbi:SUPT4H1 family protein [Megaselia abdita]
MSFDTIPKDLRGLRACLVCSLIKTFEQFENDGCDNCESFLRMKNNKDNVYDHTSNNFDGLIALMNPDDSWVCKWQRIGELVCLCLSLELYKCLFLDPRAAKGMYAISVSGKLPLSTVRDMKNRGIPYRSRDTSQR